MVQINIFYNLFLKARDKRPWLDYVLDGKSLEEK